MTRDELRAALADGNVRAFLRVIRAGESGQGDDAYRLLYGGKLFQSFDKHPTDRTYERYDGEFIKNGKLDYTTAAGAYQFTETTWNDLVRRYGFEDFSPANQDQGAVAKLADRGALDDVIAGRLDVAISALPLEWTSLALQKRRQAAPAIFSAYGGVIKSVETEAAPDVPAETPQEVSTMGPWILPILEGLVSLLPQLGGMFANTEVSKRNVAAGGVIAEAIVKATGAVNLQEAAERIQNDPAALQAARQAVSDIWPSITEAGSGGIGGARAANADANQQPPWKDKTFLMAAMFYPLIAFVIVASMLKVEWLAEITPETRAGVIMFVLGTICGGFMTYFTGTSASSQKKDALLAAK